MKTRLGQLISLRLAALVSVLVCGGLGTYLITTSHAATPIAALETENSTVSGNGVVATDMTASGDNAIKFGVNGDTGVRSCPSLPAFPDASCTGVPSDVTLTNVPGSVTSGVGWTWKTAGYVQVTSTNAVLSGLNIHGGLEGMDGLTLKNSRIDCTTSDGQFCVDLSIGSKVSDCDIGGGANGTTLIMGENGVYAQGTSSQPDVLTRVNIHHMIHGIHTDGYTLVQDSYIHDMPMQDSNDDHTETTFVSKGFNISFIHNNLSSGNSAVFFVQDYDNDAGGVGNMDLEDNLFTGITGQGEESSFGITVENKDIRGPITIKNNTFSTTGWQIGPIQVPDPAHTTVSTTITVSGNKYVGGSTFNNTINGPDVSTDPFHY